jgi:hypothetical protein
VKLTTDPNAASRSRLEAARRSRLFPEHVPKAADTLTRAAIIARLGEANSQPTPAASPPPEVSAAAAAGLSPLAVLDLIHGVSANHALRHRSGSGL